MSDSDSDYNVEAYIKPEVKRSTYENDDNYLEEEEKSDNSEKSDSAESEEEVIDDIKEQIKEDSQCVLAKELPNDKKRKDNPVDGPAAVNNKKQKVTEQPFDKRKKQKVVEEEPVRTNNRFILYVSNLSSETTKTMLEAFFADCGALKSVRIPKKRLSHFAFVEMQDFEGFKNGLTFDGKELDGRKIKVQQGSKNKKHITNKTRMMKKNRLRIYESKFQNRIKNETE
ncbi:nucleolin-like [Chironomus tepperi]|uniref:nucleolin-like n=1 Tax=Chironomus tepperi TaxID=113505 RepID=UPI00391F5EFE